jgi:anti-sigma factor RsiW
MSHADNSEPDVAALAMFVDDRLSGPERASAIDHLASCARCRTIVAELTRARAAAPRGVWRVSRAFPVAAGLAIALVGGSVYWWSRDAGPDRAAPVVPPATAPVAPPSTPPVVPAPVVITPPAPAASGTGADTDGRGDRTRAAGTRSVGAKGFRLVAGDWIDLEYRPGDFLPVIDVTSPDELTAHPVLGPFTPLGPRFTVVIDGNVYRVALPAAKP